MAEPNPDWIRDELILALDLYQRDPKSPPGKNSREIRELSELLDRLGQQIGLHRQATFRNANGVYMKLMNFRRLDPTFQKEGKRGLRGGSRLDQDVWNDFAHKPKELRTTADAIREQIVTGDAVRRPPLDDDNEESDFEALEGTLLTRQHRTRERNRTLISRKKTLATQANGRIACEVCGFDYAERYGERGIGFIECHHGVPLHSLLPGTPTKLADLSLISPTAIE